MDYFWFFVWLGFFPFFQLFFGRKADCGQCNQVDEWSGWLAVFAPRAGASCNTREYGLKGLRRSVCNPRNYPFIAGGVAAPLPRTDSAISCITQHFPLALFAPLPFRLFCVFFGWLLATYGRGASCHVLALYIFVIALCLLLLVVFFVGSSSSLCSTRRIRNGAISYVIHMGGRMQQQRLHFFGGHSRSGGHLSGPQIGFTLTHQVVMPLFRWLAAWLLAAAPEIVYLELPLRLAPATRAPLSLHRLYLGCQKQSSC